MQAIIDHIRSVFHTESFIPLHEPRFWGNEKAYLNNCIDSTFVSSVGEYVSTFENTFAEYTGGKYAIATVNGTAALHICLMLADVQQNDEVITQPLTFIATCNAISYLKAHPVFIDVSRKTMGLCPEKMSGFLNYHCEIVGHQCRNKYTGRIIKACVPMHTFGHPCEIEQIRTLCDQWHIQLIEDSAESLGSYYRGKHTGRFGELSAFSFNGNKIITAGGGGVILTNSERLAKQAKHLTTTAKIPHAYEFNHDEIGYNYRMPNLNAALLMAQMEQLDYFLAQKRKLTEAYQGFFDQRSDVSLFIEPKDSMSNYWLQTLIFKDKDARDHFLTTSNAQGVMTRPIWKLMTELPMFASYAPETIENAKFFEDRIVNIPSSVIDNG